MSTELLKIAGGTVYDPANNIDGQVRDIWVDGGAIVAAPSDPAIRPARQIDAAGLVVMPGGVDIHCHIAGPKVNIARRMLPEQRRLSPPLRRRGPRDASFGEQGGELHSGTLGDTPSTFATGYKYIGLGYTTAFDAAIAPLTARHAHLELADTPCIDKGCYLLMADHHYLLEAIRDGDAGRATALVGWLLNAAKGYAPKLVNPGGVESWKRGAAGLHTDLDRPTPGFGVTARQIIVAVAEAAAQLNLPHPLHLHANNLGVPGNWETTLETMRALEGRRAHLAHIQFHSYGGEPNDPHSLCSRVGPLVDYFNSHDNLSVDVGQVLFGPTVSMTGDSAVGQYLSRLYGKSWYSHDTECEAGCGVTPIEYKDKSLVNAWQWAIGLEWFLLARDPWRIAMSTDHPNGGSFLAYPKIIRLLMDRGYRHETLAMIHPTVGARSALAQLDREYSLQEICIITRAAPARMLGLTTKGHLGPGGDADITIYSPHADREQMFSLPRHVIKAGEHIFKGGELRRETFGKTLSVAAPFDSGREPHLEQWFNDHYSIRYRNYPVDESYFRSRQEFSYGERKA